MIVLRQVTKTFRAKDREVAALRTVDLEIKEREFFVLLGPSGSGKTTLLRCVAGLEKPEAGEILLGTQPVYSGSRRLFVPPEERGLGMVFQSYAVWPHMTVLENIALPLTHGPRGLRKSVAREKAMNALAMVQLADLADRPVPLLSGGQQQRVALARALAVEPEVLLMDEPLSNLDARLREEVRSQIKAVVKKVGVAVLYVTHDQAEAMALADRIAVMATGKILQLGSPSELYRSPINRQVADFFGSMNWLSGKVINEGRIETEIGVLEIDTRLREHATVALGIRPEEIKLGDSLAHLGNEFAAEITARTFLGDQMILELKVNGRTLCVRTMSENGDALGTKVFARFPKGKITVFPEAVLSETGKQ
jgi:iron(III) transport system ATP-binding protein